MNTSAFEPPHILQPFTNKDSRTIISGYSRGNSGPEIVEELVGY